MSVVRIPPTLRAETGGEKQVEARGENVRELLVDLMGRFPALREQLVEDGDIAPFVNVYVGGEDVRTMDGLETPIREGTTVILLPAMAGGSIGGTHGSPEIPLLHSGNLRFPFPPPLHRLGLPPG
jgi:molybdopterin synthase sulfur carrier subunit